MAQEKLSELKKYSVQICTLEYAQLVRTFAEAYFYPEIKGVR